MDGDIESGWVGPTRGCIVKFNDCQAKIRCAGKCQLLPPVLIPAA